MELDPLRLLLVCIIVLTACQFLLPEDGEPGSLAERRDLRRDHALGSHSQWRVPGCPLCYP